MPRVPITVMGFKCERCGHEWVPRDINVAPRVCPSCKTPYWDRPKASMTYEEFRNRVWKSLVKAGKPLTWTELRTQAKLTQKFPNNRWVRRLEEDIGLLRLRDDHRIIHWELKE